MSYLDTAKENMAKYLDKCVLMCYPVPLGVDNVSLQCPDNSLAVEVNKTDPIKNGDFLLKDSGERKEFGTGAVRDASKGKGRFDLIPAHPLRRLAKLYEAGSIKYAERNWEKGIPTGRFFDSAFRHLMDYAEGDRSEDHLIAVAWNIFGLVWTQEQVRLGKLPASLLTFPEPKPLDGTTQDVPF